jgi:hypothetical protein
LRESDYELLDKVLTPTPGSIIEIDGAVCLHIPFVNRSYSEAETSAKKVWAPWWKIELGEDEAPFPGYQKVYPLVFNPVKGEVYLPVVMYSRYAIEKLVEKPLEELTLGEFRDLFKMPSTLTEYVSVPGYRFAVFCVSKDEFKKGEIYFFLLTEHISGRRGVGVFYGRAYPLFPIVISLWVDKKLDFTQLAEELIERYGRERYLELFA